MSEPDHTAWVGRVLEQMLRVKPGQSRKDLLVVFEGEGGLFTDLQRTYASRECPYFKVNVTFREVGRPAPDAAGRVPFKEDDRDIIATISQPYLQFSVID